MGSSKKTATHCAGCKEKLLNPAFSRTQVWCDDCQHAEEPQCTCLLPADVLGWPHSKKCPANPARWAPPREEVAS